MHRTVGPSWGISLRPLRRLHGPSSGSLHPSRSHLCLGPQLSVAMAPLLGCHRAWALSPPSWHQVTARLPWRLAAS